MILASSKNANLNLSYGSNKFKGTLNVVEEARNIMNSTKNKDSIRQSFNMSSVSNKLNK